VPENEGYPTGSTNAKKKKKKEKIHKGILILTLYCKEHSFSDKRLFTQSN